MVAAWCITCASGAHRRQGNIPAGRSHQTGKEGIPGGCQCDRDGRIARQVIRQRRPQRDITVAQLASCTLQRLGELNQCLRVKGGQHQGEGDGCQAGGLHLIPCCLKRRSGGSQECPGVCQRLSVQRPASIDEIGDRADFHAWIVTENGGFQRAGVLYGTIISP